MSFQNFYLINTSTDGTIVTLIQQGQNVGNLKAIIITNTSGASKDISLSYQNDTELVPYNLLFRQPFPAGGTLLLDSDDMLAFNNSSSGYSLYFQAYDTSTKATVILKR
tara:strand:- start:2240 stop:2566 length:327 start_codon:yes stop_codon:yes gene_type:complete